MISQAKIDMACLKLLLSSSLTFIVTTAVVVNPDSVWLMRDVILPEHYNIKLATYINDNIFYGESNISINLRQPTYHIYLHAEKLCMIDMLLITNIESVDKDDEDIYVSKPIYSYDNKTQIFNLYFATKLLSGRYILNIKFMGIMADNGGIRTFHKEKRENIALLATTDFQTFGIRQIFPCWDDPAFHATFNISIMHHQNYKVLSNMPVKKMEVDENGMLWTHFDTTPAMPTYLVAMVIVDKLKFNFLLYESMANTTMWCRSNSSLDLFDSRRIIQYFMLYLQMHSKHKRLNWKVNHVAISNFQDKGTGNLGLILYRESDIVYSKDKDPVAQKFEMTRLIGYKILQEWFHNVLNTTWCDTLWLNEAFVTFYGVHVIDQIFPDFRMTNLFVVQVRHEAFHLHADFEVWPSMSQVKSTFEMLHHFKAFVIFRMLQHTYSHELFWDAMNICIYNYEYDWLSKYDFWTALGIAYISGQTWNSPLKQEEFDDVTRRSTRLRSWMKQEHYLILWVFRHRRTMNLLTLQIFNATEDLVVPLTYTTQSRLNFNPSRALYLHVKSDKVPHITRYRMLDVKSDDWVIFNLQQIGYYRVHYDDENWDRLSRYLNSKQYKNIHVLNRAQIIDDAFNFLIIRQFESTRFWRLVHYLWQETEYVVWYPMFKALEYMSIIFLFDKYDARIDYIKTDIRNIIHGMLEEGIGYFDDPKEHEFKKCLREEAAKWSCLLGHSMCREMAENALQEHRTRIEKILPWWKHWVYCNALVLDDSKIWREMYDTWVNKFDHEISRFLLCTENVRTIKIYLSLLLDLIKESESHTLRMQAINNFLLTIAKHVRTDAILSHILNNFEKMVSREIGTVVTLTVIINHIYTEEQLDGLYNFVTSDLYDPLAEHTEPDEFKHIFPRTEESKAEELSIVQDKIKLRYNEIRSLNRFLQIFS